METSIECVPGSSFPQTYIFRSQGHHSLLRKMCIHVEITITNKYTYLGLTDEIHGKKTGIWELTSNLYGEPQK